MEKLKKTVDQVAAYLVPLLPLANSHTVDFIVDDVWPKVIPPNIKHEVEQFGLDYVLNTVWNNRETELSKFICQAQGYIVEQFECFKSVDCIKHMWKSQRITQPVKINEFMTDKKLHEIENMSELVADLADVFSTNLVVDVGSGKGYLTSVLALHHRLHVLGLENKPTNVEGANRTTNRLEVSVLVYYVTIFF